MTPPAKPDERGQRVCPSTIRYYLHERADWIVEHGGAAERRLCADLCFDLEESRATIAELRAENERLRAALATARRDGWIEGRDAAADAIQRHLRERRFGCLKKNEFGSGRDEGLENAEALARALTPPAAADGGRDG